MQKSDVDKNQEKNKNNQEERSMIFPKETRILIVEDMEGVRSWVRKQLNGLGFNNILEAENGKIAVEILKKGYQEKEPIELILSDWRMPECDGLELLQIVSNDENFRKIPFIMISAESETPQVLKAMQVGVNYYISKPLTSENLRKKLEQIWECLHPKGPHKT